LFFFHLDFRGEPGRPDGAFCDAPAEGRKSHEFKREISGWETSKPSPVFRGREKCVVDEET
jgi:hypothetical protein